MKSDVLDYLKKKAVEMEAELIIQELSMDVFNKMTPDVKGMSGQQMADFGKQKQMLEMATESTKIVLANLKDLITKESGD